MGRKKVKLKSGKRMLKSRYVMQKHLGRKLLPGEVVHHIDEDESNDSLDNLELLPSQAVHAWLHRYGKRRTRPETYVCEGCGKTFETPKHGVIRKYHSKKCYQKTLKGKGNPNYRHGRNVKERG